MPATPRPWVVRFVDQIRDKENDHFVADCLMQGMFRASEAPDNAALIVRAVNSYDDLLAVIDRALTACQAIANGSEDDVVAVPIALELAGHLADALTKARAT